MHIDVTVLEKLEKLSSLKVDESRKNDITNQLSNIVEYVENLNELNTDGLDASFSTLSGGTPTREDIPKNQSKIAKEILARAPMSQDDFFIVPAIIE